MELNNHRIRSFHSRALKFYDFLMKNQEILRKIFPSTVSTGSSDSSPAEFDQVKENEEINWAQVKLPVSCPNLMTLADRNLPLNTREEYEYLRNVYSTIVSNVEKVKGIVLI